MKQFVFYHGNCMDGTGAAAAHFFTAEIVNRRNPDLNMLEESPLSDYVYHPINYNVNTPELFAQLVEEVQPHNPDLQKRTFWFLDFTPTEEVLLSLLYRHDRVIILDHHQTGIEMIESLPGEIKLSEDFTYILAKDNRLSGASLTNYLSNILLRIADFPLKHFADLTNVKTVSGQPGEPDVRLASNREFLAPTMKPDYLYRLIHIRDLWIKNDGLVPKTDADAFNAFATHHGLKDLDNFIAFVKKMRYREPQITKDAYLSQCVREGQLIVDVNQRIVDGCIKTGHQSKVKTGIGDIRVCVSAVPNNLASQFGETWNMMSPDERSIAIAVVTNYREDGVVLSIRSKNVNSRLLAEKIHSKGGGHDFACGCSLDELDLGLQLGSTFADVPNSLILELTMKIQEVYNESVD